MNWLSKLAVAALVCAALPASAQQSTASPAEAYGRLPAVAGASISPDGRHLIVFQGEGNAGRVSIFTIEENSFTRVRTLNAPEGGSIRGVDFADDRFGLVTISQTFDPTQLTDRGGYMGHISGGGASRGTRERADATESSEFVRQLTVDINTGQTAFMLSNARYAVYRQSLGAVSAPVEGDPGWGRMVSVDYAADMPHVVIYRVSLENGVGSVVQRGTDQTQQFCSDPAGRAYARLDYDDDIHRWKIFAISERGGAREVVSGVVSETEEWRIPGLACRIQGRAPNVVAVSGYADGATLAGLRTLDLDTGAWGSLYQNDSYDAGAMRDPYTREVVGWGWTETETDRVALIDEQLDSVYRAIEQRFGGAPYSVDGWDRGRTRFIVRGDTIAHGPGVFLFEPATNRMRVIGYEYPELTAPIPVRQAITYRARDGARIPAFLTLPPGVDPTNLPLVVMPHGGPHAQNVRGFDWWSGFMASRGYAVLEPDFRGSTGYGREWEEAGYENWGNGVMQNDVTDGVRALTQNGTADARRVCIVGASYGGYAALAGAAFTPDLYACAISVAGVSDLGRMFVREERATQGDNPVVRFWSRSMGEENFERDSPARHIDAIRAPVLLIHGAHDTVVPFDQSTWMERRMREAGKSVRLVELQGDDHWLSDASTRTQMLREVDQFLAQNIGQPRN